MVQIFEREPILNPTKGRKNIVRSKINEENLAGIRKKHYFCAVNIMLCKHYVNMLTLIINTI